MSLSFFFLLDSCIQVCCLSCPVLPAESTPWHGDGWFFRKCRLQSFNSAWLNYEICLQWWTPVYVTLTRDETDSYKSGSNIMPLDTRHWKSQAQWERAVAPRALCDFIHWHFYQYMNISSSSFFNQTKHWSPTCPSCRLPTVIWLATVGKWMLGQMGPWSDTTETFLCSYESRSWFRHLRYKAASDGLRF